MRWAGCTPALALAAGCTALLRLVPVLVLEESARMCGGWQKGAARRLVAVQCLGWPDPALLDGRWLDGGVSFVRRPRPAMGSTWVDLG